LVPKNTTSSTSSDNLGRGSKKLEGKEKEVEKEKEKANSDEDPSPLDGSVAATGAEDLVPSCVRNIFSVFLKEIYVTNVSRSGWAFLAALKSIHVTSVVTEQ
jgi:hypothetical protein